MAACAAVGRPALAIGIWRMLLAAASLRWTKARRMND
jgi:hypothetical protein